MRLRTTDDAVCPIIPHGSQRSCLYRGASRRTQTFVGGKFAFEDTAASRSCNPSRVPARRLPGPRRRFPLVLTPVDLNLPHLRRVPRRALDSSSSDQIPLARPSCRVSIEVALLWYCHALPHGLGVGRSLRGNFGSGKVGSGSCHENDVLPGGGWSSRSVTRGGRRHCLQPEMDPPPTEHPSARGQGKAPPTAGLSLHPRTPLSATSFRDPPRPGHDEWLASPRSRWCVCVLVLVAVPQQPALASHPRCLPRAQEKSRPAARTCRGDGGPSGSYVALPGAGTLRKTGGIVLPARGRKRAGGQRCAPRRELPGERVGRLEDALHTRKRQLRGRLGRVSLDLESAGEEGPRSVLARADTEAHWPDRRSALSS